MKLRFENAYNSKVTPQIDARQVTPALLYKLAGCVSRVYFSNVASVMLTRILHITNGQSPGNDTTKRASRVNLNHELLTLNAQELISNLSS